MRHVRRAPRRAPTSLLHCPRTIEAEALHAKPSTSRGTPRSPLACAPSLPSCPHPRPCPAEAVRHRVPLRRRTHVEEQRMRMGGRHARAASHWVFGIGMEVERTARATAISVLNEAALLHGQLCPGHASSMYSVACLSSYAPSYRPRQQIPSSTLAPARDRRTGPSMTAVALGALTAAATLFAFSEEKKRETKQKSTKSKRKNGIPNNHIQH